MNLKKIGKALLFPHIAVLLLITPVATAFLICSMVLIGTQSVVSYISYALAAYVLTVWCIKMPTIIGILKKFKNENKFARIWLDDARLRINVSLYASIAMNTAYSVFQLVLGIYHSSFWFCSLAWYYISLAVMRYFLVRYTGKNKAGENMRAELLKYRVCGFVFLLMNIALTFMIFFMVYFNRTFIHHEITTISMAAYTFTSLAVAIVGIAKYRRYNSPVYIASKTINLAAACVSLLTLESTMLNTFGNETMDSLSRKIMLGASGGVISAFILGMAIYMIVQGTKQLRTTEDNRSGYGKR